MVRVPARKPDESFPEPWLLSRGGPAAAAGCCKSFWQFLLQDPLGPGVAVAPALGGPDSHPPLLRSSFHRAISLGSKCTLSSRYLPSPAQRKDRNRGPLPNASLLLPYAR